MVQLLSKAVGGPVAFIVSYVMRAARINPVAAAATVIGVGLPAAAIGLTLKCYDDAQQHTMGEATGVRPGHKWIVAAHNWGRVELRSFATEEEARVAFRGGLMLRRILVRLNDFNAPDDNGHGWKLPWRERGHAGWRPDLDDEIRRALLRAVR